MPSSQHTKKLTIRLPDLELRRIKSLAVLRGVTLQHAVRLALQAWASQPQPGTTRPRDASPDPLADVDLQPTRQDQAAKPAQVRRRVADARPASQPMGGQAPDPEETSLAWLRQAGKLDWSKCPAVERVPGKAGRVWVFRGTRILLARVFRNLEEGHPIKEIAEAYGLTREQVMAVLHFAAEGFVLPAPTR